MAKKELAIGFVGFGEAGFHLAKGLHGAGVARLFAYDINAASAVKMCRSIVVKGLDALLFECVLGATSYGADDRVFASLDESFPGMNWRSLATYMMGRVLEHGERRAAEMEEAARTLRETGVEPMMAEATARRQAWGGQLNLLDRFGGKAPESYQEVVRALSETNEK